MFIRISADSPLMIFSEPTSGRWGGVLGAGCWVLDAGCSWGPLRCNSLVMNGWKPLIVSRVYPQYQLVLYEGLVCSRTVVNMHGWKILTYQAQTPYISIYLYIKNTFNSDCCHLRDGLELSWCVPTAKVSSNSWGKGDGGRSIHAHGFVLICFVLFCFDGERGWLKAWTPTW